MSLYFTAGLNLSTTSQLIVPAENIDRVVHYEDKNGASYISFDNAGGVSPIANDENLRKFVLPAGVELWAAQSGTTASYIEIIVTSVGR